MSTPKDGPLPEVEVHDAAEAFQKFEDFGRRVLAVPKKEVDRRLTQEKAAKMKKRRRR